MRKGWQAVLVFLILGGVAAAASPAAGWWVLKRAEKSLKTPIQGRFEARYFHSAFTVHQAVLNWEGKISLSAGDLDVNYDFGSLFSAGGLRVKVSGHALPIQFLGDLAKFSPREQVIVDDFYADLVIGTEGLKEVTTLKIQSPEIQFHLGRQIDSVSQ